jgi:biopolymer transport protein ExbD
MKINTGNINNEPRIELIPLIDVIFCILTFFLLAGLQVARQQAISIDIPKAATGTPAARELLMVSLNDAGQVFLEQQPMLTPAQLSETVKKYHQSRPNSSIVLYASKQVSYNRVVEILDSLRSVAGDRVALATLPTNTVAPTLPTLTNPNFPTNPGVINPNNGQPNTATPQQTGQFGQPTQIAPAPAPQPVPTATPQPTGKFGQPTQIAPAPATQPVPTATPQPTPRKSTKP